MSGKSFSYEMLRAVWKYYLLMINFIVMMICVAEEKEPYEEKARADKRRYKEEISGYKNTTAKPSNPDSGNDSGSD